MEPIYQNLLGMFISVIYVQLVVTLCDWSVRRDYMSLLVSRKTVHMAAASLCMLNSLVFDISHWTWILNSAVPVVYSIQLIVKGLILANPNDADVKTMSRTVAPHEICQGPLFFVLILLYINLFQFQTPVSTFVMAAVGFGDGLAPIIGTYLPWGYYLSSGNDVKTMSGSAAVFGGTILGIFLIRYVTGVPDELDARIAMGVALVATVAEGISGKWDNPVIALSVFFFLQAAMSKTA